jgi:endonuclease/exonuclease/phosphatase family metal-dependent hydrolase
MRFRVTTWNCFGMAQDALDAVVGGKAPAGLRLQDPHVLAACTEAEVLCIQELLSRDAELLFDSTLTPGRSGVRDHNRLHFWSRTARGTGLGLGARGALSSHRLHHFSGPAVGWDRLARKGALFARVELAAGPSLDVVTTHLQSGYEAAAADVRAAQLEQLARFVAEVGSPERPMIVAGDFNIDGLKSARSGPEYPRLRRALPGFDDTGEGSDMITFHPHPEKNSLAQLSDPGGREQRIDYVFFRPATAGSLRCVGLSLVLDEPLPTTAEQNFAGVRSTRAFASDHFGLSATFELGEQVKA